MQAFPAPTTPVDTLTLTFVDVETTGLDPEQGDRVCEIALLQVRGAREVTRFMSLTHPQRAMPPRATAINGITDTMLHTAPPFASLIPSIRPLLRDTVVVAHNAHFDVRFLYHEFAMAQQTLPRFAVIDTLALARAWYRLPHNSLEALAKAFGIPHPVRHRALTDVLTTWKLWQRFVVDRQQVGALMLAHVMHPRDGRPTAELEALTSTLYQALLANHRLYLRYRSGNDAETLRVIEPLEIHYAYGHGYVRAFCHMRQDERNFRLDRIVELKPVRESECGVRSAECGISTSPGMGSRCSGV
jgi:DNA polymerase-3 subunit epsilon